MSLRAKRNMGMAKPSVLHLHHLNIFRVAQQSVGLLVEVIADLAGGQLSVGVQRLVDRAAWLLVLVQPTHFNGGLSPLGMLAGMQHCLVVLLRLLSFWPRLLRRRHSFSLEILIHGRLIICKFIILFRIFFKVDRTNIIVFGCYVDQRFSGHFLTQFFKSWRALNFGANILIRYCRHFLVELLAHIFAVGRTIAVS